MKLKERIEGIIRENTKYALISGECLGVDESQATTDILKAFGESLSKKKDPYPFPNKESLINYKNNYYQSRYDEGYNQAIDDINEEMFEKEQL